MSDDQRDLDRPNLEPPHPDRPSLKGRFIEKGDQIDLKCRISVKQLVDHEDAIEKEAIKFDFLQLFQKRMDRILQWILKKLGRNPIRRYRWKTVENPLGGEGIASALETIQGERQYEDWFLKQMRKQLERGDYDQAAYQIFLTFRNLRHIRLKTTLFSQFPELQYLFLEGFQSLDEFKEVFDRLEFCSKIRLLPQLDEGKDLISPDGEVISVPGQLLAIKDQLAKELKRDGGRELTRIFLSMDQSELEDVIIALIDLYYPDEMPLFKRVVSCVPEGIIISTLDQLDL
jgi:hypothetical protein